MENSNNEQKSVEQLVEQKYPINYKPEMSDWARDATYAIAMAKREGFIAGHTAATEGKDELFRNFIRENSLSSKWEKYLSKQPNF